MRKRLSELDLMPACDPPDATFKLAVEEFEPLLIERELARDAGRAWQLDRLAETSAKISAEVRNRLEGAASTSSGTGVTGSTTQSAMSFRATLR